MIEITIFEYRRSFIFATEISTQRTKMNAINKHVIDQFLEFRRNGGRIHDTELRAWALAKSAEVWTLFSFYWPNYICNFLCYFFYYFVCKIGLGDFTASFEWVYRWKKMHRVVSRKIVKISSRAQMNNAHVLLENARTFVGRIRNIFDSKIHFYIDQSGFNLECLPQRTLEIKGTQQVHAIFQSTYSATHSYIVQPIISADRDLMSPLFIVLQERNGRFGEIVRRTMFSHPDLYVVPSTSGKVTNSIIHEWFIKVSFHQREIILSLFSTRSRLIKIERRSMQKIPKMCNTGLKQFQPVRLDRFNLWMCIIFRHINLSFVVFQIKLFCITRI